jgi:hypothetical protein
MGRAPFHDILGAILAMLIYMAHHPPVKNMKKDILIAFIVTRLGVYIIAASAYVWLPHNQGPEFRRISHHPSVDMWHRWDAGYFTRIALHGYGWQAGHATGDMTFMPLYPTLVRLLVRLIGPTHVRATVAGVALSNACLLAALFVFDSLMALDHLDARLRRLAIWLFLVSPATKFFSGVYTEALFFLLSLGAIYAARRERWIVAGLAGFLAAMTRVMGWTLAVALLYEAWAQVQHLRRARGPEISSLTPLVPVPLYAGLVGLALGSHDAYFTTTTQVWDQGWGLPWRAFTDFFGGPIAWYGWKHSVIDLVFTLGFSVLSVAALRLRPGYGLYSLAVLGFPVLSGTLISMPRYVAVAFPAYIVLAQWAQGHRWRAATLITVSVLLTALVIARFVTWRWIA